MKKINVEVTKYIVVGAINYVLSFAIFFWLLKIAGVNYLLSLAVVAVLGVLFTYTLNYIWVFKPESKIKFKGRLIKYTASSFTTIIMNLIILRLIVEHRQYDPFYVQVALTPVIVAINFIAAKFWSLKAFNKS